MSKFKFIVFVIILLGCKSTKSGIEIIQIDANHPIILKYSKKHNKFSRLKIPLKLKIYNNSFKQYSFASIRYEYNSIFGGITEDVYIEKNKKLEKIKNNKRKYINLKESQEYVIYTSHRLDSGKKFQDKFKSYINLIKNKNIDTLNIGSINELKSNNKDLLKLLTKNDSIFINTWKGKDITIPVKL